MDDGTNQPQNPMYQNPGMQPQGGQPAQSGGQAMPPQGQPHYQPQSQPANPQQYAQQQQPAQTQQQQQPAIQGQPAPQQRNPLRIDDALLAELGLSALPDEEKKALQKHIYETLEMNVGMRLADQMSNEQLDEFETYFNARDDAGAFRWLETNFPNYKDIVAEEFEKLKGEVAQNAPHILAASQQQAQQPPQQPQQSPNDDQQWQQPPQQ